MAVNVLMAEIFQIASCVRGYHVYKAIWNPFAGQEYTCEREEANGEDPYAVAIISGGVTVGHVPRKISAACSLFLQRFGHINCIITGSRRYSEDLPQGGLEIPCLYTLTGESKLIMKMRKLLAQESVITSPPQKRIKIEVEEVPSNDEDPLSPEADKLWVAYSGIQLMDSDKTVLCSDKLTDKHIDFAQELLKNQFPRICGLQSTLLTTLNTCSRLCLTKNSLYIQVLHCEKRKHWVVISTRGSAPSIQVYDSFFSGVDDETLKLCVKLFGPDKTLEMGECTQQINGSDCGVHAIAIIVALAHGKNPSFSQKTIRQHLISCYESMSLSLFP